MVVTEQLGQQSEKGIAGVHAPAEFRNGAVLIEGEQTWHGSEAIAELSRRMNPSDPLLGLLAKLFSDNQRSALAYPALLAARRVALATRGLSVDPDQARSR